MKEVLKSKLILRVLALKQRVRNQTCLRLFFLTTFEEMRLAFSACFPKSLSTVETGQSLAIFSYSIKLYLSVSAQLSRFVENCYIKLNKLLFVLIEVVSAESKLASALELHTVKSLGVASVTTVASV